MFVIRSITLITITCVILIPQISIEIIQNVEKEKIVTFRKELIP